MTIERDQVVNLFGTHDNQAILVYIDESGDSGLKKDSSKTYTLGCVMVEASHWGSALEALKNHRRGLKNSFGMAKCMGSTILESLSKR
jgi:cation transport regulator ChaC